jgi:hypothetical protein
MLSLLLLLSTLLPLLQCQPLVLSSVEALVAALASPPPSGPFHLAISGVLHLASPLTLTSSHSGLHLSAAHAGSGLTLGPAAALRLQGADHLTLSGLSIARLGGGPATPSSWHALPAALSAQGCTHLTLTRLAVQGGVRLAGCQHSALTRSDISNALGTQNGTCAYVPHCGISASLTPCNLTLADNLIHDCRYSGQGSVYAAAAQGVLLGAQGGDAPVAALGCTTGVVVRNNNLTGIDQMGIRVATDYDCASALNQVLLNKVENWGQLSAKAGGDTSDSGCLYQYGHWHAPGNNFSFNFCASRNASWGQNGMYLDDAASGTTVHGNVFFNSTGGSAIKLNGGSFNTVANNLVIGGNSLGFAVCRGLRPPLAYIYTCANPNTGGAWLKVLAENNYTQPPWATAFPFYADWCSRTAYGPSATACAPPGAPPQYGCASFPLGNTVTLHAGVAMLRPGGTFDIPVAPGFPFLDPYSHCPQFVVDGQYNSLSQIASLPGPLADYFVDPAAEDFTLLGSAPLFAQLPGFQSIPFRDIGIRSHS